MIGADVLTTTLPGIEAAVVVVFTVALAVGWVRTVLNATWLSVRFIHFVLFVETTEDEMFIGVIIDEFYLRMKCLRIYYLMLLWQRFIFLYFIFSIFLN